MSTSRVGRSIVTLAATLFSVLGLAFWIAPEQVGHALGIEAVRATGTAALRADLGGLFLSLAILCAIASWTMRRSWFVATAVVLATIAIGRVVGWITDGITPDGVVQLAIELVVFAALVSAGRDRTAESDVIHRARRPADAVSN